MAHLREVSDVRSRHACLQPTPQSRGGTGSAGRVWDPTRTCVEFQWRGGNVPLALGLRPHPHPIPEAGAQAWCNVGTRGHPAAEAGCFKTAFGWTRPCGCYLWDTMSFLKRMEVNPQVVTNLLYSKDKELVVLVNEFRATSSHAYSPYTVVRSQRKLWKLSNQMVSSAVWGELKGRKDD